MKKKGFLSEIWRTIQYDLNKNFGITMHFSFLLMVELAIGTAIAVLGLTYAPGLIHQLQSGFQH